MSLFAADGSIRVTVVDGTTITGNIADDQSINVFETDGTSAPFGAYHPCGAWNVTVSPVGVVSPARAPNGSLYVVEAPYNEEGQRVTVVSGAFGGGVDTGAIYGLAGLFGTWS